MVQGGAPGLGPGAATRSIGKRNSGCPKPSAASPTGLLLRHRGLWLALPRPPRSLLGVPPTVTDRAVQWLGRWGILSVPSIYGDSFFWFQFSHLGSADQHPCIYPSHKWKQGCLKAPNPDRCGTARTKGSCRCCYCSHAGCPALPYRFSHSVAFYVPPVLAERLDG